MTGFGRTGAWFGIEGSGVRPDLVTCGKGMSGGYMPVGAVLASERIVDALHRAGGFTHGFTFSHNPVTAAACLATLEILEARGPRRARPRDWGRRAARPPASRSRSHPHVGDVRGRGLMFALELVADKATRRPFPRADRKAEALAARCFENGLVVYPGHRLRHRHRGRPRDGRPAVRDHRGAARGARRRILDRSLTELGL